MESTNVGFLDSSYNIAPSCSSLDSSQTSSEDFLLNLGEIYSCLSTPSNLSSGSSFNHGTCLHRSQYNLEPEIKTQPVIMEDIFADYETQVEIKVNKTEPPEALTAASFNAKFENNENSTDSGNFTQNFAISLEVNRDYRVPKSPKRKLHEDVPFDTLNKINANSIANIVQASRNREIVDICKQYLGISDVAEAAPAAERLLNQYVNNMDVLYRAIEHVKEFERTGRKCAAARKARGKPVGTQKRISKPRRPLKKAQPGLIAKKRGRKPKFSHTAISTEEQMEVTGDLTFEDLLPSTSKRGRLAQTIRSKPEPVKKENVTETQTQTKDLAMQDVLPSASNSGFVVETKSHKRKPANTMQNTYETAINPNENVNSVGLAMKDSLSGTINSGRLIETRSHKRKPAHNTQNTYETAINPNENENSVSLAMKDSLPGTTNSGRLIEARSHKRKPENTAQNTYETTINPNENDSSVCLAMKDSLPGTTNNGRVIETRSHKRKPANTKQNTFETVMNPNENVKRVGCAMKEAKKRSHKRKPMKADNATITQMQITESNTQNSAVAGLKTNENANESAACHGKDLLPMAPASGRFANTESSKPGSSRTKFEICASNIITRSQAKKLNEEIQIQAQNESNCKRKREQSISDEIIPATPHKNQPRLFKRQRFTAS